MLGLNLRILGGQNLAHIRAGAKIPSWVCRLLCRERPCSLTGEGQAGGQQAPWSSLGQSTAWLSAVVVFLLTKIHPFPVGGQSPTHCHVVDIHRAGHGDARIRCSHGVLAAAVGAAGFLLFLASVPDRDPALIWLPAPWAELRRPRGPHVTRRRNQHCCKPLRVGAVVTLRTLKFRMPCASVFVKGVLLIKGLEIISSFPNPPSYR